MNHDIVSPENASHAVQTMTPRQRIIAALKGEPHGGPLIWLREGFPIAQGPADADDFQHGWQADPLYRELFDDVASHAIAYEGWAHFPGGRQLMVNERHLTHEVLQSDDKIHRTRETFNTPLGGLERIREIHRNMATGWQIHEPVHHFDELRALIDLPFEVDDEAVEKTVAQLRAGDEAYGDRGFGWLSLSSPIVHVSALMPFQLFLEGSIVENELYHELLEETTRRVIATLDAVYAKDPPPFVGWLGGSEQCTPPMMPPQSFDEFVVPYDRQIIAKLHEHHTIAHMHCHGQVRHALSGMLSIGVDATDPIEPPPAGDLSIAEARQIVGDRMTLMGNLEWDELEYAEPERIRERVREIVATGHHRLIIGASAGPISQITPKLAANYRAWIDECQALGVC